MNRLLKVRTIAALLLGVPGISSANTSVPPTAVKKAVTVVTKSAHAPSPAVPSAAALQAAAMNGAKRAPASAAGTSSGSSKDISEELKIMGQSRNLSMGLLFQKDKDKLTFGTPRTNYEDKVSDKKANF
jgi:hypothetical protein